MTPAPDAPARRARVGYLGPAGTFSEEALLASADAEAVEPVALASIYDTVMAVLDRTVGWSIVPIENSLEGSINVTLDLLAGDAGDVEIAAEQLLRVRHALVAPERVEIAEIDTVVTHPQVPGQCARFLRARLPDARVLPATSTAEAVRAVVADGRRQTAAIGTELAARIYGATVIREGIEDRDDNETRFVWLTRRGRDGDDTPPLRDRRASGEWKTSLVFWGAGSERPGWLVRCLAEFADRDINLTKIESRPRRERLGSYMFFADLGGSVSDRRVAEAIARLCEMCEEVSVLGSYRAARRHTARAS